MKEGEEDCVSEEIENALVNSSDTYRKTLSTSGRNKVYPASSYAMTLPNSPIGNAELIESSNVEDTMEIES